MSEQTEIYKAMKQHHRDEKQALGALRRARALKEFPNASIVASQHKFKLAAVGNQGILYRLTGKAPADFHGESWLLDIYPGNQRLYCPDRTQQVPPLKPLLHPIDDWRLMDVVKAVVACAEGKDEIDEEV